MGNMGPFSHFSPQSAKKGARNLLFNKPFGPWRPMTLKMRFWAQKCGLGGPKSILGPKMRFRGPKSLFGVRFAPWHKRLIKQMVSGPLLHTFGPEMQNRSFLHFRVTKCKKLVIYHFWSQKCSNELISGLWLPK